MKLFISKVNTVFALGLKNCLFVISYRLLLYFSLHPVCFIKNEIPKGPFFSKAKLKHIDLYATSAWDTSSNIFSHIRVNLNGTIPNWLSNPLDENKSDSRLISWWKLSDFDESRGDIKLIWEQSRMNWVIAFSQRASQGDQDSLDRLNIWLTDWLEKNPPYLGLNWKCGQEASIRVINLCCASLILGQEKESLIGLQDLIRLHLQRIAPTINYAIAQDNNHGTSEAAALFMGGSWLNYLGARDGESYERIGRKLLNERVSKLIEKDGSFSQYSLNYHRMMLDTLSICEIWREKLNLKEFTSVFYQNATLATNWLYQMVCPLTGEVPNLGANDGSLLLQLTDSDYGDYRPCVNLASSLFINKSAYLEKGLWDLHLAWLGVENKESKSLSYENCDFDCGGYKIMRSHNSKVIFKFPKFRFRPSQSDAMHIDFWAKGLNYLSDAGTYSYSSSTDLHNYFSGTISHNTVQFDDRDQMPKLGRFLYGNWLNAKNLSVIKSSEGGVECFASYKDFKKVEHSRKVSLNENRLEIIDKVSGFDDKAVIRWRLLDHSWSLIENGECFQLSDGSNTLTINSDVNIVRAEIVEGWSSLFYMKKKKVPVMEVEITKPGIFRTEFKWSS